MNAMLNYNHVNKIGNDVAKTLCARDYKGFGTGFDTMNGSIRKHIYRSFRQISKRHYRGHFPMCKG